MNRIFNQYWLLGLCLIVGLSACNNDETDVSEITNQSTGFCPEPESWPTVAAALDAIPIDRPDDFTTRVVFRLCPSCNERNIVKDGWFVCELCGADLPKHWNFPLAKRGK